MRMALFCFFLIVNFSGSLFAMETLNARLIKIIVGGDVEKISFEPMFQDLSAMPGAKYEFVEQLIDETLPNITPDYCTYILYVIDHNKFINFPESYEKVVPILREVQKKFPKSHFPLNMLLTNINTSSAGLATAKILDYFMDKDIIIYLNNIYAISEEGELQMLKDNLFRWCRHR